MKTRVKKIGKYFYPQWSVFGIFWSSFWDGLDLYQTEEVYFDTEEEANSYVGEK